MNGAGESIDARIAALWAGLERVSAMPTDSLLRAAAITAAKNLADGIRERAAAVAAARADADARIRDHSQQATALASELASLNTQVQISSDPVLRDRRDLAARQLADLVGGSGRVDPDGQLRWTLPDGGVLVDGERAARLEATPDPATGFRKVVLVDGASRRDVTSTLTGGRLAGELTFRDVDAAVTATELDQLAVDLVASVNAVHQANAGLDGVSGRVMFTPLGAVAGAADLIEVDPALITAPDRLATAAAGTGPGNNNGAMALLDLRNQRVAAGGTQTLSDAAIDLIGALGRRAHDAGLETDRATVVAGHLGDLRDALSGVDLDEEMANLVRFQHGAEAMTRFITTVDGMLGDLLARL
jgi:flagellar hook-associated protein 1 FlgK